MVLRGAAGFFSSGADLNTVAEVGDSGERIACLMHHNLMRLERLSLITVALVEGKAIGGGAELCTPCDFRLMTADSEIGFVHILRGISPGWGGGSRLARLIGPAKSLRLLASGERLSAAACLSIGLADHILDPGDSADVLQSAKDWLSQFTIHAGPAIRACKQIVTSAKYLPLEEALMCERKVFAELWGESAHRQAKRLDIKHK